MGVMASDFGARSPAACALGDRIVVGRYLSDVCAIDIDTMTW